MDASDDVAWALACATVVLASWKLIEIVCFIARLLFTFIEGVSP